MVHNDFVLAVTAVDEAVAAVGEVLATGQQNWLSDRLRPDLVRLVGDVVEVAGLVRTLGLSTRCHGGAVAGVRRRLDGLVDDARRLVRRAVLLGGLADEGIVVAPSGARMAIRCSTRFFVVVADLPEDRNLGDVDATGLRRLAVSLLWEDLRLGPETVPVLAPVALCGGPGQRCAAGAAAARVAHADSGAGPCRLTISPRWWSLS